MTTSKKQLKRIYLVIVVSFLCFLAVQQFLLHLSTIKSKEYSTQINKAGKQRMLSQKLAKLCLLYTKNQSTATDIQRNLNEWNTSHEYLIQQLQTKNTSDQLYVQLKKLTSFHRQITKNVHCLLADKHSDICLTQIINTSEQFLQKMDAIVNLYDAKSQKATQNIMLTEYVMSAIALIILLIEILVVFRPSARIINNQEKSLIEQLEIIRQQELKLNLTIKELTDSLNYAKKVQETILPDNIKFTQILSDSFVVYLPKQIVAGDFYLLEEVASEQQNDELLLLAVGDCTGHGVPGAMVSLICHNAIHKAIHEDKLIDPAQILNNVNESIRSKFSNENKGISDGMDISLCCFNKTTRQLLWAGANLPLWIVRNQNLIEIKPDKQPIGNYVTNNAFTLHTITLEKNDLIYLFSDGFSDQFGGESGKKLSRKQFQQMVIMNSGIQDLSNVEKFLTESLEQWKGDHEQVDDITVLGIRF